MKKDMKHTFISFSSFDNNEKGTHGVFFQLFSDSDNVKRLPSTCLFELVKVNELISTQYKFNPRVFFQLFLDSDNVKILSSTCLFELVKVNELISTQYNFNPFPD